MTPDFCILFYSIYLALPTELKLNCQDLLELDFTEQLELLLEEMFTETL